MARRLGIFRRTSGSDSGEGAGPAGSESSNTYETWSEEREQGDTHPASETDPASMPSTQEWQVVESGKPVRKVPPADTTAERAGSNRWLPNAVPESTSAMSGEAPVADSGSAERAAQKALSMAAKRGSTPATPGSRIAPTQEGPVSLASATFDDLRALGLSVTQAKRVLNFRERLDGFDSVDDLNHVPGFPKSILSELKSQVTL